MFNLRIFSIFFVVILLLNLKIVANDDYNINYRLRLIFSDSIISGKNSFLENKLLIGDKSISPKEIELLINVINNCFKYEKKNLTDNLLLILNTIKIKENITGNKRLIDFLKNNSQNLYTKLFVVRYSIKAIKKNKQIVDFINSVSKYKEGSLSLKEVENMDYPKKFLYELPYIVLQEKITEGKFLELLNNEFFRPFTIDAILFSPFRDYYIGLIIAQIDKFNSFCLKIWARTITLSNYKDSLPLLNKLEKFIPQIKNKDGSISYGTEKGRGSIRKLSAKDIFKKDILLTASEYKKAKQDKKLIEFFSKKQFGDSQKLKSWILAIKESCKFPQLVNILKDKFAKQNLLDISFKSESGYLLNLLKATCFYQGYYENPDFNGTIIENLINSKNDFEIFLGLKLFQGIKNNKIDIIKGFLFNNKDIIWKDHIKECKGPLIAYCTVEALFNSRSSKVVDIFKNAMKSNNINPKVANTIRARMPFLKNKY